MTDEHAILNVGHEFEVIPQVSPDKDLSTEDTYIRCPGSHTVSKDHFHFDLQAIANCWPPRTTRHFPSVTRYHLSCFCWAHRQSSS